MSQKKVRQAENDRESEELAKVLSISLHEVSRESVNNDDGMGVTIECSEKTKSFNLTIQNKQKDSEQRHGPDFKTVFEIMIGPFSFCEIGKT